ncbi:MAG: twin-arginine translocase TatA/TatE family subunit [Planctomycetaceae bacterium]|nr:twin-arginine translocase TatA/TatE family subunit [Planctomycetaceae bacterium]
MGFSYSQLMIVLIAAVVLFGSRLPDVLRQVGRAYAQLRRTLSEFQYTIEDQEPSAGHSRSAPRIGSGGSAQSRTAKTDNSDPVDDDFARGSAPKFTPPPANDSN